MHASLAHAHTHVHAHPLIKLWLPHKNLAMQVREISNQVAPEPFRWTAEALLAIQEVIRLVLDVCLFWFSCMTLTTRQCLSRSGGLPRRS